MWQVFIFYLRSFWHLLTEKNREKNPPHLSCSFSIFFARSTCRASRSSESMESSWREGRSSKKTHIKSEANNYNPSKWFGFVKEIWWNLSKPSSMYSTKQVWRHGRISSHQPPLQNCHDFEGFEGRRFHCALLRNSQGFLQGIFGGFLTWWYPTTMGFPTKNDHFGVWNGGTTL